MITRRAARRRRRSYVLRSECQGQRTCIADSMPYPGLSCTHPRRSPTSTDVYHPGTSKAVSPQNHVGNVSLDSAYFTSPESLTNGSPAEICAMRTRSATWLSSLRSLLQKPKVTTLLGLPSVDATGPSASVEFVNGPKSEGELNQFLFETWTKEAPHNPRSTVSPVSQYVKKIGELKAFFQLKMAEISQKEVTYIVELKYFNETTPSPNTSHLLSTDITQLREILTETKVGQKFDQLRLKLKQEVAQTILQLRAQYISDPGRRRRSFRPKTTKILSEWFDHHVKHPYPTELEKKLLASQCDISVEQVTRWFNNRRCRSKSISRQGASRRPTLH